MSRELGIRLYYLRTHKTEYTQQDMANLLHLDRSAYGCYELGRAEPKIHTVRKLAEIFEVSCDDIINPKLSETEIADYELSRKRGRK